MNEKIKRIIILISIPLIFSFLILGFLDAMGLGFFSAVSCLGVKSIEKNKYFKNVGYGERWGNIYFNRYDYDRDSCVKVKDYDFQTFTPLNYGYAKDKNNVYYYSYKYTRYPNGLIENADLDTFLVLNSIYAKDKNNVYYGRLIINGADLETFIVLSKSYGYAKDKNNVYFLGEIDKDKNPETFIGN